MTFFTISPKYTARIASRSLVSPLARPDRIPIITLMPTPAALPRISASDARRLLLSLQHLSQPPAEHRSRADAARLIRDLGYVQIDSINAVERAHHLILHARSAGYRPDWLHDLIEKDRTLFEHWTHDASAIPVEWYPHWKHRFAAWQPSKWWKQRFGTDFEVTACEILRRVESDGPLRSRDFDHQQNGPSGGWWGWKPHKAALEFLWRRGDLCIAARDNFQKVYDLTGRIYPDHHAAPAPSRHEHLDWAGFEALRRLGFATHSEIAAFFHAVRPAEISAWCRTAHREGRIVQVRVESGDGSPDRLCYALPDWESRLRAAPPVAEVARLLCPFDPVIRDRKRLLRLFNFDYRFEAFTPEPKRKFGYYSLLLQHGDRIIGIVDPRFDRSTSTLTVNRIWRTRDCGLSARDLRRLLEPQVDRLAGFLDADWYELPPSVGLIRK